MCFCLLVYQPACLTNCVTDSLPDYMTDWVTASLSSRCLAEGNRIFAGHRKAILQKEIPFKDAYKYLGVILGAATAKQKKSRRT